MSRPDLLGGFGPPKADRSAATRALKDLVRKAFDLEPEAPVFVAEVACGEIDCPDMALVLRGQEAGGASYPTTQVEDRDTGGQLQPLTKGPIAFDGSHMQLVRCR